MRFLCLLLLGVSLSVLAEAVYTPAGPEGPAQTAYAPEKGAGPVVIVLSGALGMNHYQGMAADVARMGYYAVLIEGNDVLTRQRDGDQTLRKVIERAQRSPQGNPGKAAVVGYSAGGGGAIAFAATMPEHVSMVVAYYPSISFVKDAGVLGRRFKVPVLVLAGEQDTYRNCCLIGSMRAMEAAAKESGAQFELVVYPEGRHGFNHPYNSGYRRDYDEDAFKRMREMLDRYQPLGR